MFVKIKTRAGSVCELFVDHEIEWLMGEYPLFNASGPTTAEAVATDPEGHAAARAEMYSLGFAAQVCNCVDILRGVRKRASLAHDVPMHHLLLNAGATLRNSGARWLELPTAITPGAFTAAALIEDFKFAPSNGHRGDRAFNIRVSDLDGFRLLFLHTPRTVQRARAEHAGHMLSKCAELRDSWFERYGGTLPEGWAPPPPPAARRLVSTAK